VIIEPLQKDKHHRLAFASGEESLDRFLHQNAHQASAKGLSKTYVALDESDETQILGYYTITTTHIEAGELPEALIRKLNLPKSMLPASLVARLAVSERIQGRGIGSLMLMDAMARCARVASEIGGVAIIVDALQDSVAPFYEALGFTRFDDKSLKLFILMATVREMLGIFNGVERQTG
jgi:GNAT superfamily N-acetyltransferase